MTDKTAAEKAREYAVKKWTDENGFIGPSSLGECRQFSQEDYLTGYNDALPKWISVKERLPERDGCYQVYLCETSEYAACISEALFSKYSGWNDYMCNEQSRFTHWQPMPLPPSPEQADGESK